MPDFPVWWRKTAQKFKKIYAVNMIFYFKLIAEALKHKGSEWVQFYIPTET